MKGLLESMGPAGYAGFIRGVCAHLTKTDVFFFKQTCPTHWRLLPDAYRPLPKEFIESPSQLQYLYDEGYFINAYARLEWTFRRLPQNNTLSTMIWLKEHHLIYHHSVVRKILEKNYLDCIGYGLERKWFCQSDIFSISSTETLERFLNAGFTVSSDDFSELFVSPCLIEWIMNHQHLPEYNLEKKLHLNSGLGERILDAMHRVRIERHILQVIVEIISDCPCCGVSFLDGPRCAFRSKWINSFISSWACTCGVPERHQPNKRIKRK